MFLALGSNKSGYMSKFFRCTGASMGFDRGNKDFDIHCLVEVNENSIGSPDQVFDHR